MNATIVFLRVFVRVEAAWRWLLLSQVRISQSAGKKQSAEFPSNYTLHMGRPYALPLLRAKPEERVGERRFV